MCNLETEGTKYGCGHYKVTREVRKNDCASPYCVHSNRHSPNCSNCHCDRYLGPDSKETITFMDPNYCASCNYWFKGPGSRPIRR